MINQIFPHQNGIGFIGKYPKKCNHALLEEIALNKDRVNYFVIEFEEGEPKLIASLRRRESALEILNEDRYLIHPLERKT